MSRSSSSKVSPLAEILDVLLGLDQQIRQGQVLLPIAMWESISTTVWCGAGYGWMGPTVNLQWAYGERVDGAPVREEAQQVVSELLTAALPDYLVSYGEAVSSDLLISRHGVRVCRVDFSGKWAEPAAEGDE